MSPSLPPMGIMSPPVGEEMPMPVLKTRPVNLEQLNSTEDLQDAIAFVQKSCTLAKRCMDLHQYECAFRILAKVEATTQLIAKESRRGILSKVNQEKAREDDDTCERVRKVSFSDDVVVGLAEDIDRTISPVERPSVQEMLFVRACRDIPSANYSKYWTE